MTLRDLFRRRTDAPDPPVPAPARRPDWPTMPPVQRAVNSPDLITAPDRFTGSLVSWRNPSRGGTLGHYVTPDAPAGVSDGLATISPRTEPPPPEQPWRRPSVQRRVPVPAPTNPPVPELDSSAVHGRPNSAAVEFGGLSAPTIRPSVVPVYPLGGRSFVSAAGAEPPPPRWAVPAVQRRAAEPEASRADPDAVNEPPEAPLPPVVELPTEPAAEVSAGSAVTPSPARRPDLPVARRLGLGAPLQRIPDAGDGQSTGGSTVQRQVGAEPADVAPLVSHLPPMTSASPTSSDPVVIPSVAAPAGSTPVSQPSAGPAAATSLPIPATPTDSVPATVQRQVDAEPLDVAPLVSDSPPIASVAASPIPSDPVTTNPVTTNPVTPPVPLAAGFPTTGPSPSPGSPTRPAGPGLAAQRAVDTTPQRDMPLAVVGLVGDRPLEPVVAGYAAAVDSAAVPVAAPATEQSRWPALQRQAAGADVQGVTAVQSTVQRMGGGTPLAASWPPGVLPVRTHRAYQHDTPGGSWSSTGVDTPASPDQAVQFAAAPITVQTIPAQLRTELVVQRADDAGEPAAETSPTAATEPGATMPAPPAGSTSSTEVDTLVRRLYDPIVRRLKAELQLDRERAGHSLDLRH